MKKAEAHYGMGQPALKTSHSDGAGTSNVFNPEKGALPHYQQAKWMQDSVQGAAWPQEAPVQSWGQNFAPYIGGVNVRGQMPFHKGAHDGLQIGGENQLPAPVEVYRDATQPQSQGRGLEWEQHAAAAMHQAQLQAYHHKGMELQNQPSHALQGQVLQPFQASFRPNKQQFPSEYYSVFTGNKQNMVYGEQPKTQQQLLQQMQQQQQMHHHHQQQQQQQHQLQLQQQMQQQQMQQMQQQYHQQQIQEQQQQMQQMQQLQQQNVPQPEQPQVQSKQQPTQNFGAYPHPELQLPDGIHVKEEPQSVLLHPETPTCEASPAPDQCPEKVPSNPLDAAQAAPRRSRRLSREGQSPLGPPPANPWAQAPKEPPPSLNGVPGVPAAKGGGGGGASQAATGGVIQNTRRRRRASKEINLETLAQKASEMESLPAKAIKQEDGASSRQPPIVPLVIPVSVPVPRSQTDPQGGWAQASLSQREWSAGQSDRKPSVIVARRRSRRNSVTESFSQEAETDSGADEDGKSKFKRRPRPEPLIIPPPKASSFIPPSLYSSITSYQSNLRSPIRLPENPHSLPPYTPPPILSPVRGGSGLYFSAFLTNMASNQILPPPATPKSATRSLLRSVSSDITPPVLPIVTDAAPVSLEPRINIGSQYQAEIPSLQNPDFAQNDQHQADLLWLPLDDSNLKHVEHFMNLACSSVLEGGGTNQELVLHCLHESGGNFLVTLERLMLQEPIFPDGHHLKNYHYSGSDRWTREEKRYFNKGISAYRKDFFLVQTLVRTKTVAQCVEFYYTYKKQVKIGRNSILTFGPPDSPTGKHSEAVVEVKSSQLPKETQEEEEDEEQKEKSYESHESTVARSLRVHDYAGTVLVFKEPEAIKKEPQSFTVSPRNRAEPTAKKAKPPPKPPQDPNAVFPCKKCGRVFSKVKSRSAHMKSHAEQEKKAAALRQKEEEEHAAAAQAQARKAAASAAAAAAAARHLGGNGWMQMAELSSQEDTSEAEDDNDADWQ
ncbi:ELM2 and SANT domain-containing protein 1 [Oryzias melastigma]|uniref:ELM2 and SANT domain-containing protein 1 n=1 Tax=Oryzias melastigma TaxID=30732 RepID=A0A834BVJ1_ORYME|nr:ELM2 and SANT domain-containing protein 1 [Oryzias melastigma]